MNEIENIFDDIPLGDLPSITWLKENLKTKSERIRYLTLKHPDTNLKVIADYLKVSYQHAYNVRDQMRKRELNVQFKCCPVCGK